jgi:hypothetical protein
VSSTAAGTPVLPFRGRLRHEEIGTASSKQSSEVRRPRDPVVPSVARPLEATGEHDGVG